MDDNRRQRRLAMTFALAVGVFIAIAVGYIAVGAVESPHFRPPRQRNAAEIDPAASRAGADHILLIRDRSLHLDGLIFTYRGRHKRQIVLEVIIPALDPQFAYLHDIPFDKARRGFRVAGRNLALLSAHSSRARFRLDP